jgi:hypothetical protein
MSFKQPLMVRLSRIWSTAAQISVGEGVWNASCDSGNPGSITGFGLS